MRHFNERWQAVVLKEQQNKITNHIEVANILYFACIFDKFIKNSCFSHSKRIQTWSKSINIQPADALLSPFVEAIVFFHIFQAP